MKKITFFILILLIAVQLIFPVYAASDVIVAVCEAEGGKSIHKLEAGDVITVRVVLPEMDDVRKLQFDLNFEPDTVEYNGDAKPESNEAGFTIVSVGQVTEQGEDVPTVRFVAGASEPLTFSGGSTSFSASFTVKADAPTGQSEAFSLSGLSCDDESVSLNKASIKITVCGAETSDETAAAPKSDSGISGVTVIKAACIAAAVIVCAAVVIPKVRKKR